MTDAWPTDPTMTYSQACAIYERRRRALGPRYRVRLAKARDELGYVVDDGFGGDAIRATPGNVWPHPGDIEIQGSR